MGAYYQTRTEAAAKDVLSALESLFERVLPEAEEASTEAAQFLGHLEQWVNALIDEKVAEHEGDYEHTRKDEY